MNQHKGLSRISSDQNTLTFQLYMKLLATKIMFLSVEKLVPRYISSPASALGFLCIIAQCFY